MYLETEIKKYGEGTELYLYSERGKKKITTPKIEKIKKSKQKIIC